MANQTEQIESIRQREVREGNLFDCPHRYYATVKMMEDKKMCAGFRMGVGGRGLSPYCSSCNSYAQSSPSSISTEPFGYDEHSPEVKRLKQEMVQEMSLRKCKTKAVRNLVSKKEVSAQLSDLADVGSDDGF